MSRKICKEMNLNPVLSGSELDTNSNVSRSTNLAVRSADTEASRNSLGWNAIL